MNKSKLVAIGILSLLILIIVFQNIETVETKILFITLSMPRAILLAFTWLIGAVCGMLLPTFNQRKKR